MRQELDPSRRLGNRLSARSVQHATKPGHYCDGWGLYLLVGRHGAKSWIYRYQRHGRSHDIGLGSLRLVSLAEARDAAQACRKLRHQGEDPLAARRAQKAETRLAAVRDVSFEECAKGYIAAHEGEWSSPKSKAAWEGTLSAYAYPKFGKLPVQEVGLEHVKAALEPIWQTKTETAKRLRGRIEIVLDWAKTQEYRKGDNPARWRGHLEHLLGAPGKIRPVKHHPALPYQEIPEFMAELGNEQGDGARCLEATILTALRTKASRGAKTEEFDFTGAAPLWTVPPERIKRKKGEGENKPHRVPLSTAALALFAKLHEERTGALLFPGTRRDKPISDMTMLMLLRRMGRRDLTVHGFRSTFKDWAHEQTDSATEVIEMALAHAIPGGVEKAYRRGELLEKRRELMEKWGQYCCGATVPVAC